MSFFKDIKGELEQAVNDIDTTEPVGMDEEEDLFALASEEAETDEELLAAMMEEEAVSKETMAVSTEEKPATECLERENSTEEKSSVTVITKGTTINGSIISDCSLDVMGTITGDVECLGKLSIFGKVNGNCRASEVFVNADRLEGSIHSEGCVKIGLGTVVVGDIVASSAVFAGAVKGEIDVKGPVVLDSTAIIKGNIKAKSIQMNNGAVMDGSCSFTYADFKIDNIFE